MTNESDEKTAGILVNPDVLQEIVTPTVLRSVNTAKAIQISYRDGSGRKLTIPVESEFMADHLVKSLATLMKSNYRQVIHESLWRVSKQVFIEAEQVENHAVRNAMKNMSDRIAKLSFTMRPEQMVEVTENGFKHFPMRDFGDPEFSDQGSAGNK